MGTGDRDGHVFISYARSTEAEAARIGEALTSLGCRVWRDDQLPAHRAYSDVIEERLQAATAVVVVWSAEAAKSHWVRAEAEVARQAGKLVQVRIDGAALPLPFNQIQCADLAGWRGEPDAPGWRKVAESVRDLLGGGATPGADVPPAAAAAPPLPKKPSLAVLPFANLSRDPDQDYFAEGMMEEIASALARIRSLFVIASRATLALAGEGLSPQEAARRLGVRYVLEGSVRRSGAKIRITASLTDAREGEQIWAERFEDTLEDVFELQDRVALSVAGAIEPTLLAAEARRIARRPIESLGAYDLYLRAASLRATLRQPEVAQALALLERVIELEPDFAPALAHAAGCHSQFYFNHWDDEADAHRRAALDLAERAIECGSDDAAVLAQAANAILEFDADVGRATALIDRATSLNAGSAFAWLLSGIVRLIDGQPTVAIEHLERAARLDPVSHMNEVARAHIGVCHALLGEYADASRLIEQTSFRSLRVRIMLAAVYGHLGRAEDAARELGLYEQATSVPAETMAATMSPREEVRRVIVDGLALARTGATEGA